MDHIAHIKNTGGLDNESVTEETVSEHCKKTALLARSYSAPFNMESTVFVSALLHDSGKLNNDFDGYIKHANGIKRGEIDHSYAGAKFLLELVSNDDDKYKKEVARLIARIIISHHGLNDWYTRNNDDYFDYRCSKNERYDEIKSNISELTSDSELDELLNKAADEYRRFFEKMKEQILSDISNQPYPFDMLIKKLNIKVDNSRNPMFDVMFTYQNKEENTVQLSGKSVNVLELDNNISKFNLSIEVKPKMHTINVEYCTKLFKKETIENLFEHY